ncbi:MAG: HAMP domain-containing sensor histidine kinase [Ferruginibacter sp.]
MKLIKEISYRYIIAAIVVFIVCLPLLFIGLQYILTRSVDEDLSHQKEWIIESLKSAKPDSFTSFNNNITIQKEKIFFEDSVYTEDVYIRSDEEMVPHRILITSAIIDEIPYLIRIQKSLVETHDMVLSVMVLLVFILLVLFVSLYFVNNYLSKKIWRPFTQTIKAVKNYRVDKHELIELPNSNITEFKELQNSIYKLAETNTKLFNAQKTFTENAAHELQTPIAIITANVDLLFQQPELTALQASYLENINRAGSKIFRLNKALLLLSKIENKVFGEIEEVDLSEIIKSYFVVNEELIASKFFKTELILTKQFFVNINKDLAEILVNNLLSNAVRHNILYGSIIVESSLDNIVISNSAVNGPLQDDKLFQRFQKQSVTPESLGLGLEICKQICNISGLNIKYNFNVNMHEFIISKAIIE